MEKIIKNVFNNNLNIEKHLGQENNNEVFLGDYLIHKQKKKVLVKMISRSQIKDLDQYMIELGFLKYLSNFNSSSMYINQIYNCQLTPEYIIIVAENPEGIPLSKFINQIKDFKPEKYFELISVIMFKILLGINYIHKKGVAHRGLNPETIYINYKDGIISSLKFTDFAISCGNYVKIDQNINLNQKDRKSYYKFCQTIEMDINPPENFDLDNLVKKIKKITRNQTRNSIYLYLAKKSDIWALGILFWKLINYNPSGSGSPLDLEFNQNGDWKTFKGNKKINKDKLKLIKNIHRLIIDMMLNNIPHRGKSNEILDSFLIEFKYHDDD